MVLCVALLSFNFAQAQDENEVFKLGVEARFDYLNQSLEGHKMDAGSGLKVRYFNLRVDGQIASKFSYSWRQLLVASALQPRKLFQRLRTEHRLASPHL